MIINDWLELNPNVPLRVIMYTPAPDILDEHGNLACGGEGTSKVVFDSTISDDLPFDLRRRDIISTFTDDDGITVLEFLPDECYFLY